MARAATAEAAADAGDLSDGHPVPGLSQRVRQPLVGKAVIDANTYHPSRDGHIANLDRASDQQQAVHATFGSRRSSRRGTNLLPASGLARRPAGAVTQALPIAGDNTQAKAAVTTFLDTIGYGTSTPARSLRARASRRASRSTELPRPYEDPRGRPASEATIRAALAAATR